MEFKITKEIISGDLYLYTLLWYMETNYWQIIECRVSNNKVEAIDYLMAKAKEKSGSNIVERFTL